MSFIYMYEHGWNSFLALYGFDISVVVIFFSDWHVSFFLFWLPNLLLLLVFFFSICNLPILETKFSIICTILV